ncbi:LamB [Nesidiocoris tenuis]|uniref:LamB n=1 Tax=Nesidiocoris tenuis TaxID=355587 RepID=A0ABN7BEE6_9HEMI|nr:LamB [Nesidiocoris tenuis]
MMSDCDDGEDEENCSSLLAHQCPVGDFPCGNGQCIEHERRCDGVIDCPEASDEYRCPCLSSQFQCDDGKCIEQSRKCDQTPDCLDGSDERDCDRDCTSLEFRCSNGTCIAPYLKCNGQNDCPNGEDEREPECPSTPTACLQNEFACNNGQCVHRQYLCDDIPDCSDRSDEDENYCAELKCQPDDFYCDGGKCIRSSQRCDDFRNCDDGTDEDNCGIGVCAYTEYECESGQCIEASQRCNNIRDCSDGSDEKGCDNSASCNPSTQFTCDNGQCVSKSAKCNNQDDCSDGSDEVNCITTEIQLITSPTSQEIEETKEAVFQCRDEGPSRYRVRWIRGDGQPLPEGSRSLNNGARLEIPNVQLSATGAYVCEAVGAPRTASGSRATVYLKVNPFIRIPEPLPDIACAYNEATCYNRQCIPKNKVCDGEIDCTDGSDESRCSAHQVCEANQFMCDNRECVMKTWRCDNQVDCLDGSDEKGCDVSKNGTCYATEFACASGNQCIPRGMLCDKTRDCHDNSDEIGCKDPEIVLRPEAIVQICEGRELILRCQATGFPIPIINWRLNWGHVPKKCRMINEDGLGTLVCPDMRVEDTGAYSCEAINGKIKFANPDANVVVRNCNGPSEPVCPAGSFNDLAQSRADCIQCFCFGKTPDCSSARLEVKKLPAPTGTYPLVLVRFNPTIEVNSRERSSVQNYLIANDNGFEIRSPIGGNGTMYNYFLMPPETHGKQLNSYGGYITYKVTPGGDTRRPYIDIPDIVIQGNNLTLTHKIRNGLVRDRENEVRVQIIEGTWLETNPSEGRYTPSYASREDIMMALADIENILIRVQYIEGAGINTAISDITMDTAGPITSGRERAQYVEQCRCPRGYTGLSCEECEPGFVLIRQPGAFLGVCSDKPVGPCPSGSYGAPERGIPCRPCPCPLSSVPGTLGTCRLGPSNQAICDCQIGYAGYRCERCDTEHGYRGDARIGNCRRPSNICNDAGSRSTEPLSDGTCDCKTYTTGARCDQCKQGSFFLSSRNQYGCTKCFCMGTTQECTSSNLYRDSIETRFRSSSLQDFTLVKKTEDGGFEKIPPFVDQSSNELYFDNFDTEVYYWSLPPVYIFNKVTSYGGNLRYTIRYTPSPGGLSSRNSAPDVEITSANRITLYHYSKQNVEPEQEVTINVPLLEEYWQKEFGQKADREDVLQALADVSGFYIKATYTTSTTRAALISVSLDVASERNTGRSRALEVEQCRCLPGYMGTSCEDCAPGYTRAEDGLYLRICEPCDCGGYSEDCDPESGECRNCRDNRAGQKCEYCKQGFTLSTDGSCRANSTCSCDERGTVTCRDGRCICKVNVEGDNCGRCRRGTFHLSADNEMGCGKCFCSEVTSDCQSSSLYMEQVPAPILDDNHGFTLSDGSATVIRDGFNPNFAMSELGYRMGWRQERLFWSLPSRLTGDKVLSYGGTLAYVQRYTTNSPDSEPTSDHDIIISGNGRSIFYSFDEPLKPEIRREALVPIVEGKWRVLDQRSGNPIASRRDILKILSSVDHILIRATLAREIEDSYISDVLLETATQNSYGPRAEQVEVCRCPPEYRGTSCQNCADNHYRNYDGRCLQCPCVHGRSCLLSSDYQVKCNCEPGWQGDLCDVPVSIPGGDIRPPPDDRPQIRMDITVSPQDTIPEGSRVTLTCIADSISREPLTIRWSKQGGRLPRVIDDNRGRLTIISAQSADSGVYYCTATGRNVSETKSIIITVDSQSRAPSIQISPSSTIEALNGNEISVQCIADGYPLPSIEWIRIDGRPFSREVEFVGGDMKIKAARKADQGEYECRATNPGGYDSAIVTIYVREIVGNLIVNPREIMANTGQTITITCSIEPPTDSVQLEWSRNDKREFPRRAESYNGQLTIRNIGPTDGGEYVCTATMSTTGYKVSEARAYIRVIPVVNPRPFSVTVYPNRLTVKEHETAIINCSSTLPDATFTWTRARGGLPRKAQVLENILRIPNVEKTDRAVYICEARLDGRISKGHAFLEVQRQGVVPVLELTEQSMVLIEGGSAHVECRPQGGNPPPRVIWTKRSGQLPRNVKAEGNLLRFNSVVLADADDYVCTAENSAGRTTATFRLEVHQRPRIRTEPKGTVRKSEGERLTLTCRATGVPAPAVKWQIKSQATSRGLAASTSETGVAQVEIFSLSVDDTGYYTCKASSSAGEAEESVYVRVSEIQRPDGPAHGQFEVDLGGETEITCSHPTNDPDVTYSWTRKDNKPLGRGVVANGYSLRITGAQLSDAGDYVCEITDRNGYPQNSHIATLRVIERLNIRLTPESQIVHPGEDAYIHCEVIGDRPADLSWEGVDRALPSSAIVVRGRITFNRIAIEDAGRYACTAVDPETQYVVKALARVTVKQHFDPADHTPVVRVVGDRNITKMEGTSLFLQCTTDIPNARIVWTRQGEFLPLNADVTDNNLRINNLYPADSGEYVCTATSRSGIPGSDRVSVYVEQGCSSLGKIACIDGITCYDSSQICDGVNQCPDGADELMCSRRKRNNGALLAKIKIEPSVDRIRVGETVDLNCLAIGVFASEHPMWEKVGGGIADNVIIRDNSLRIHDVTTDNAGPYRCWVKKQNGEIVEDIYDLEVQDSGPKHTSVKRLAEKTKSVSIYDPVDIECDTGLEPPVTFLWTRRNGQILTNQTGSKIHFSNVMPSDAGEYLCVASNGEVKIEFPTFLVVKGLIPRFTQQSVSYLKLKPMAGAGYRKFDLLLSIKPERPNGLLLYNGEKKGGKQDFIAIGLKNGYVEFRYDVGSGAAIIQSSNITVPMNKWSNITVKRHRKEGRLWVNGVGPFIGTSPGRYQGLDLSEPMFLGSVPDFSVLSPSTGFDTGFVGCISYLKINDQVEELGKALEKSDILDCDTCQDSQCSNNGVCQEATNERGYTCLCPRGFSGSDCQTIGGSSACYPGLCNDGTCINSGGTYRCQCGLGTAGDNCELQIKVNTPAFNGDSFLAYPLPHTTADFSIEMDIKPEDNRNRLLAYSSQNMNGNGDFILLLIRDQQIEFTVDTGSGLETVNNPHRLETGKWVKLIASKTADELRLTVNGDVTDKILDARKTRAYKKSLNLHTPLYLGGYDDTSISLHPSIYIKEGFKGCISSLKLNERPPTNLLKDATGASNVVQCHGAAHRTHEDSNSAYDDDLCGEQRCQNDGRCDHSDGTPVCQCTSDFGGIYCEIRTNECGQSPNPCGSTGVCHKEKASPEGYRCDCFFGYSGPTCQDKTTVTTDVTFRRNSYIELPGHLTQQFRADDEISISFTIQTEEPLGLLYWQGSNLQYMSIGVKDGYIEAEVDHNDNPLTLRSQERVDNALPHNVTVTRKASDLEVYVDGVGRGTANGQPPRRMSTRESIFIGGLPDPWTNTNGRWKENFVGCILRLRINNGEPIDFSKHHISGRNVRSCPSASRKRRNRFFKNNETG